MKRVLSDIMVTTFTVAIFFGLLSNLLIGNKPKVPVVYSIVFFFITYGLWKITSENNTNKFYTL